MTFWHQTRVKTVPVLLYAKYLQMSDPEFSKRKEGKPLEFIFRVSYFVIQNSNTRYFLANF